MRALDSLSKVCFNSCFSYKRSAQFSSMYNFFPVLTHYLHFTTECPVVFKELLCLKNVLCRINKQSTFLCWSSAFSVRSETCFSASSFQSASSAEKALRNQQNHNDRINFSRSTASVCKELITCLASSTCFCSWLTCELTTAVSAICALID